MYGFSETVNLLACAPGRALHLQCRACGYKFYETHDKGVQRLVQARQNGIVASANMFLSHICFCSQYCLGLGSGLVYT